MVVSAFSQVVTDEDIARLITKNEFLNRSKGVDNPNLIYPGQKLSYIFADSEVRDITVAYGDNQWIIVKKILNLEKEHGQATPIPPSDSVYSGSNEVVPVSKESDHKSAEIPWWCWLVSIAGILAVIYFASKEAKKQKEKVHSDPTTSGTPIREGGITDEQATAYANEVAARQFNLPNLQVTNIVKGTINGTNVAVFYRNEATPQRKTFANVPGYRGEVMVNGQSQFLYFLQGCGNDARVGNYFAGENIEFYPDAVQPEVLRTANQTQQQNQTAPPTPTVTAMTAAELGTIAKQAMESVNTATSGKFSLNLTAPGMEMKIEFTKDAPGTAQA